MVMAQPISDRVDEMVTGVRADIAVKVFGDDLDVLIDKANEVARVAQQIQGTGDIKVDRIVGQQNLNVTIDRQAIARHGLNASDVHDVIEAAVGGKAATEIYEGERRFQAVVRFPENLRNSIPEIRRILVTASDGEQIPLESLAQHRTCARRFTDQARDGEAPDRDRHQCARSRPRRVCCGIAAEGRQASDATGRVTTTSGAASLKIWSAPAGT